MKHKHYNEIVAWAEGKQIQFRLEDDRKWIDLSDTPTWREDWEYRVKPNWYDNIPKKGILCWVWDDPSEEKAMIRFVVAYIGGKYRFVDSMDNSWKHATPITIEEINEHIWR